MACTPNDNVLDFMGYQLFVWGFIWIIHHWFTPGPVIHLWYVVQKHYINSLGSRSLVRWNHIIRVSKHDVTFDYVIQDTQGLLGYVSQCTWRYMPHARTYPFSSWVPLTSQCMVISCLTHWGRDKMAAISQTTLSNPFSWMKLFEFGLKVHWSWFPMVQLTIFKHCFR